MKGEYISIETARIMADIEKENKKLQEENERLNNIKNDLLYVLQQLDGYFNKGWTIDLNFTDIRKKYEEDIKKYENWE